MFKRIIGFFLLFVLVGCGGSSVNKGGGTLVARNITSAIDLPATGLNLSVATSAAVTTVSATNTANVTIFNEGPQYAEVKDNLNRVVLMGFLSPSAPNLSARSTAVAIAYLSLAGGFMKEEGRLTLLNEIHTLNGFSDVETEISNQINSIGYLNLDTPSFQTALSTLINGAMAKTRGAIISPTTASGLSADTTVDSKLSFQNVYLRRVSLFMKRTGYISADDQEIDLPNSPWTKIEMPLVARYGGITGTLDGFLKGEVPYSPVKSSDFDVPVFPADAKRTNYLVNAIGPGWISNATLDSIPAEQRNELVSLELKTVFLDAFLVLLANVAVPLKGEEVDNYLKFVGSNAAVTDIINNLRTTVPQLVDLLANGQYYDALKALFTSTYTSNTILPFLAQLTVDFIDQNSNLSDAGFDRINDGMKGLLDKMGKIDVGFTLADSALLFHDFAVSNKAERFELVVTPGNVTLTAGNTTIKPTATTTITAIVQDRDPNGTYSFEWTVTPNNNYWVEDRFLNGTDDASDGILRTAEDVVNIRSLITINGSAVVQCKVYRLDGGRRLVATDQITITFDTEASNIITTNPILESDTSMIQIQNNRWTARYTLYYLIPINDKAFFHRIKGVQTNGSNLYLVQWFDPRSDPSIYIQTPDQTLIKPPGPKTYKVYVKSGWDGIVGGHASQGEAQLSINSVIEGNLKSLNSSVTHVVEAYLND